MTLAETRASSAYEYKPLQLVIIHFDDSGLGTEGSGLWLSSITNRIRYL